MQESENEQLFLEYFNEHCSMWDAFVLVPQLIIMPLVLFGYSHAPLTIALIIICLACCLLLLTVNAFFHPFYVRHRESFLAVLHVLAYSITATYSPLSVVGPLEPNQLPWGMSRGIVVQLASLLRHVNGGSLVFYSWALPVRMTTHLYRCTLCSLVLTVVLPLVFWSDIQARSTHGALDEPFLARLTAATSHADAPLMHMVCVVTGQLVAGWLLSYMLIAAIEHMHRGVFASLMAGREVDTRGDWPDTRWPLTIAETVLCTATIVFILWDGDWAATAEPAGAT